MIQRLCRLPARQSCLLLGPRQTGKTTLVREALPSGAFSVDLLQHDVFLRYSKDPSLFRSEVEARLRAGARTIFVDEIQKIPALLDEIHGLIESTGARFLLTGSSARKLRRAPTNLLAGRAATRRLHPLTEVEIGSDFDLGRALRFGTLPPVVTSDDERARDVLESYAETYLREEIQAEALVRNLGGFGRFLDVAAAQSGELLNFTAVGREASLATRTVQEYFQILEDTLLGFRLEVWSKSPRARMVAHPRFFLFDTGVTNALCRRLTSPVDPLIRGRLFEQWLILECRRRIDYARSEARIFFWRTHHGAEVDLLIEKHGRLLLAAELKAQRRVSSADLSGLRTFADAHPKVPRLVVAEVPAEHRVGEIDVLPWKKFLDRLEDWI